MFIESYKRNGSWLESLMSAFDSILSFVTSRFNIDWGLGNFLDDEFYE